MYSANVRVVIADDELNRIRDYVASVPHRATGGLLLGHRYVRNDVELLVITRTTTRVPDERLPDERCANHPVFTSADVGKALEKTVDATFLGRWHAHLDGLSRPSGADLEWARAFLSDTTVGMTFILHPIVVHSSTEVSFHPFIATIENGTFQKVPWETASAEEIERLKQDRPPPVVRDQEAEMGIFSLHKVLGLFREEGVRVASLPHVAHAEVRDDGSSAILEVEMEVGEKRAVLHISGDPWYPLHPPALRVQVDGRARKLSSEVLAEWTSMCNLRDLVKDVFDALMEADLGEALPPPPTTETDPLRREMAMLRAAGYRVYETSVDQAGTLVTARSALLDAAGKVYHVILPPTYPAGKLAWAIADESLALGDVSFETLEELPAGFTVLTWFERLVPAAREAREQAAVSRERRSGSFLMVFTYLLLFSVATGAGYLFQTQDRKALAEMSGRLLGLPVEGLSTPDASKTSQPRLTRVELVRGKPLLAVVMDAGQGTNLTTPDTLWAVVPALKPVPIEVIQIDLRNAATDLDRALRAAGRAQAVIVFTYAAGDRQTDFVLALVRGTPKPVGVISMAPGPLESVLSDSGAFYQEVRGTGRTAAQRAIYELKRTDALVIR